MSSAPPPFPKRVSEMTPEERLESLTAWAEEQKYVRNGEGGTLPFGIGSLRVIGHGGGMHINQSQYSAPVGPPTYQSAVREPVDEKPAGPVRGWLRRRRERRRAKSDTGVDTVEEDAPPSYS